MTPRTDPFPGLFPPSHGLIDDRHVPDVPDVPASSVQSKRDGATSWRELGDATWAPLMGGSVLLVWAFALLVAYTSR